MTFSGIFAISLSGVNAFSQSLEAISNNIANAQTAGFKRARTDFSTLLAADAAGGGLAAGGVGAESRSLVHEQGTITQTNSATDLAISGEGFFVVSESRDDDADAPRAFTRSGSFSIAADGALVNEAGLYLKAARVGAAGAATSAGLSSLQTVDINNIQSLAEATANITLAGNLDADAAVGSAQTQHFEIFDADGARRTLAMTFTKASAERWAVGAVFVDSPAQSLGSGDIVFDAKGAVSPASTFPAAIAANGQTINVDMTLLTQARRASQFTIASSDGSAAGALTGVEIAGDGRVTALFSNGLRRDIYQIFLASFINAEGLARGPSSTYLSNSAAGALSLDIPRSGRAGAIAARALESSTVDIARAFSTLIETQRAYAANARVMTTADELWRRLTDTAN